MRRPTHTPDDLIDVWRRAASEGLMPYKASDDQVLNLMAGCLEDYEHANEIPQLPTFGRFPVPVQTLIDDIIKQGVLDLAYRELAIRIARVCEVDHLTLEEWQTVAVPNRNMLCVLYDPRNMHYVRKTQRLLTAAVQVTVGPVTTLALRGYISLLNPDVVHFIDLWYAKKGESGFSACKPELNQLHTVEQKVETIVNAAQNLLQEQGLTKTQEISNV